MPTEAQTRDFRFDEYGYTVNRKYSVPRHTFPVEKDLKQYHDVDCMAYIQIDAVHIPRLYCCIKLEWDCLFHLRQKNRLTDTFARA